MHENKLRTGDLFLYNLKREQMGQKVRNIAFHVMYAHIGTF